MEDVVVADLAADCYDVEHLLDDILEFVKGTSAISE